MGWVQMNETGLPTHAELLEAFDGVPKDPNTGFPIGYLGFAQELESRLPPKRTVTRIIHGRAVEVTIVPPGKATNHDPHFGKRIAQIRRERDPEWQPKKKRRKCRRGHS